MIADRSRPGRLGAELSRRPPRGPFTSALKTSRWATRQGRPSSRGRAQKAPHALERRSSLEVSRPPLQRHTDPRGRPRAGGHLPPVKTLGRLQMTPLLGSRGSARPGHRCSVWGRSPQCRAEPQAGRRLRCQPRPRGAACGLVNRRPAPQARPGTLHRDGEVAGEGNSELVWEEGRWRARAGFSKVRRMGRGEGSPECGMRLQGAPLTLPSGDLPR